MSGTNLARTSARQLEGHLANSARRSLSDKTSCPSFLPMFTVGLLFLLDILVGGQFQGGAGATTITCQTLGVFSNNDEIDSGLFARLRGNLKRVSTQPEHRITTYRCHWSDVGIQVQLLAQSDNRGRVTSDLARGGAGKLRNVFRQKWYSYLTDPKSAQSHSLRRMLAQISGFGAVGKANHILDSFLRQSNASPCEGLPASGKIYELWLWNV